MTDLEIFAAHTNEVTRLKQQIAALNSDLAKGILEMAQLRADKQELFDALSPYASASWIHHSVHTFGRATFEKHKERMT